MFGFGKRKRIYLDYAATTPLDARVFQVMQNIFAKNYFNPGALYHEGVVADRLIDQARSSVAKLLGTTSNHVVFTRGGTESCNMAIMGSLSAVMEQANVRAVVLNESSQMLPHVITSAIEHAAVLETLKALERAQKIELSIIPVNTEGIVIVDEIKKALRPETVLVSVMYVNNEIGTIQPIKEIVKLVRWYKKQKLSEKKSEKDLGDFSVKYPLVHTDAIQAANYLDIHVERLGVDLMSLSGSKIYGPKSSGVLYVRNREHLAPMFFGGDQEFGLRAGTEDGAQVVGFAKAFEIARASAESESARLELLRDLLISGLERNISGVIVNGSRTERVANNVSITIPGISGERLVIELDAQGICAASKSACKEDDGEASHVIAALRAHEPNTQLPAGSATDGAVRFTLGRATTKREVLKTVEILTGIVERIRAFERELTK